MKRIAILVIVVSIPAPLVRSQELARRPSQPRLMEASLPSYVELPQPRDMTEPLLLRDALLEWLTLRLPRHTISPRARFVGTSRTYILHCRLAAEGCVHRIGRFAAWFLEAAERYGLDPWILAAIAVHESSLDPDAQGKLGEYGLMQIHPNSFVGLRTRKACAKSPNDCTRIVIFGAASYLASNLASCRTLPSALTAYNQGKCGTSDYATRVLTTRQRLLRYL